MGYGAGSTGSTPASGRWRALGWSGGTTPPRTHFRGRILGGSLGQGGGNPIPGHPLGPASAGRTGGPGVNWRRHDDWNRSNRSHLPGRPRDPGVGRCVLGPRRHPGRRGEGLARDEARHRGPGAGQDRREAGGDSGDGGSPPAAGVHGRSRAGRPSGRQVLHPLGPVAPGVWSLRPLRPPGGHGAPGPGHSRLHRGRGTAGGSRGARRPRDLLQRADPGPQGQARRGKTRSASEGRPEVQESLG